MSFPPRIVDKERAREPGRGRDADAPAEIPARGWRDVLWRLWGEFNEDRILLVAAGATFFLLLALFPALAAFVSLYGFVADPRTIAEHIAFLGGVLPSGGLDLIKGQLQALANQETEALSFGFLIGLAIALWSANSGIKSLFDGMNVAYDEGEKRSFLWLNALSLVFTLGAIVIGIGLIVSVGIVPAALALLRLDQWTEILISVLRWPMLIVMVGTGITVLYRYGPSREKAKWRWLTWGAALATIVWLVASWAFSFYLQNFADYNATYGSLGAVIGFMMWTWISVDHPAGRGRAQCRAGAPDGEGFHHRPSPADGRARRGDGRHGRQVRRREGCLVLELGLQSLLALPAALHLEPRRTAAGPIGRAVIGLADLQHALVGPAPADQLHAHRQPLIRKADRHVQRRQAGNRGRDHDLHPLVIGPHLATRDGSRPGERHVEREELHAGQGQHVVPVEQAGEIKVPFGPHGACRMHLHRGERQPALDLVDELGLELRTLPRVLVERALAAGNGEPAQDEPRIPKPSSNEKGSIGPVASGSAV